MTILEAIKKRHSVRRYQHKPIPEDIIKILEEEINIIKQKTGLKIKLFINEEKAFGSFFYTYGRFSGVKNYIALIKEKDKDTDLLLGYYGEHLVLKAQSLGLNSCWVALSYKKKVVKKDLRKNEQMLCVIPLGYGINEGVERKSKTKEQVANITPSSPEWFIKGVEAALLAPTAVNQQKFKFRQLGNKVSLSSSIGPYVNVDLGIVKYHFEVGAGLNNFEWSD